MLDDDNRQFESRLKDFRPLAAEPLPVARKIHARRRRFVLAVCAAAVVIVVVAAVIARQLANQSVAIHRQPSVVDVKVKTVDVGESHSTASGRPLTIGSANELLADAPSVKSALDELAFHGRRKQLPRGTQSALAVLGKEDFKL